MSNDEDNDIIEDCGDDDDDEVIIGDDFDPNSLGSSTNSDEIHQPISFDSLNKFLQPQVDLINSILPIFNASYDSDSTITFMIPSNLIPSVLQIVCFYYFSPTLIEVSLTFKNASWKKPLIKFSAINPYFQQNYIGRPLIYEKIRDFFTETYVPKSNYRSLNFLTSFEKVNHITYITSPFLFLILELIDSFIDLQDHCCICHKKLPFSVIKPSICDSKLCEVGFNEIGVGTSVALEIRRDSKAADLLVSIFACSTHNPRYMNPKPPEYMMANILQFFENLPPMSMIAQQCRNDNDIVKMCGKEALDLLRWILLSNRSQLIHLPDELKLDLFYKDQFMTLIASPRAEEVFQMKKNNYFSNIKNEITSSSSNNSKKKKLKEFKTNKKTSVIDNEEKSVFLWHGSNGSRWHSIIRNGLKNMSYDDCVHGAHSGPGIYLASDEYVSISYSQFVDNLYKNSEFGPKLTLIALCEVIPNEKYKDFRIESTLQDDDAIIVRFVFPIFPTDEYQNEEDYYTFRFKNEELKKRTIKGIPMLKDVLEYLEKKYTNKKK